MAEVARGRILEALRDTTQSEFDSVTLADSLQLDHQDVVGGIKSLEGLVGFIIAEQESVNQWVATIEGQSIIDRGSYEYNVLQAIPASGGILLDELHRVSPNDAKIGFSKAMQFGWVKLDKQASGGARVFRLVDPSETPDKTRLQLRQLVSRNKADESLVTDKDRAELKKRKLAHEVTIKFYRVRRGPDFTLNITKVDTDLTTEMLVKGTWKDKSFKPYNFNALGAPPQSGHFHPLLKAKSEFRQIFLEMGFSEMRTNNYVESSFWNFDALFQPQDHPARDMQDTFFLSHPATSETFPTDYLKRVQKVHSEGDYGSQGYRTEWRLSEAKKNVLRTHTTAVSARVLYNLAQQAQKTGGGYVKPCKYFSIDRVFRNESLDATHLAEFHQIEGVIGDTNLSMAHMIGIFTAFFSKLGLTDLRFKPTYNPYTEPSMEIYAYHSGLQKHVEIGNSGLFRPEMLRPMGLPDGYRVAGWGLSLERPTMILYGIDNIRDLCGHKINLQMVQDSPICMFTAKSPALTEHRTASSAGEIGAAGDKYFDKHHDQP